MKTKTLKLPNGETIVVEFLQLELTNRLGFIALAVNEDIARAFKEGLDGSTISLGFPEWVKVDRINKLSEELQMLSIQKMLFVNGWNVLRYPDPLIIVISDTRKEGKILLLN